MALVGQLAAATDISWGLTALLIGLLADTYGQRRMLLTGLLLMACGLLGAALAWQYGSLLACRLLTCAGGAMVVATSVAMIADVFPPTGRGQAMGWWASATGGSAAAGVPLVAGLAGAGGWRLPFAVMGTAVLVVWGLLGVWLPRGPRPSDQRLRGVARYRKVGLT